MASNHSLEKLCNKIFKKKVKISSLNNLLNEINITKKISPCIFNTVEEGAGHFLAITQTKNGNILLFDPLASEITKIITEPLNSIFPVIYINRKKVQSDESEFCALFCLGFLNQFLKGEGISAYFEMFNEKNNLINNDRIICEYLMSEIANNNIGPLSKKGARQTFR